jgi:uncharacterized protein YecE (DUF72 family)
MREVSEYCDGGGMIRPEPLARHATRAGDVRIGVSGWTYPPWRGHFFPAGLVQARELAYAAATFRTIEINGTHYSLQRPTSFAHWADTTPDDFIFTVKAPRYITHMRRLRDIRTPLANFLASGLLRLGAKLGPILWQLPPNFSFDAERIRVFADLLPRDTKAALDLACEHDAKVGDNVWLEIDAARQLRHAMEVRHESFRDPAFVDLLREHEIALVCADTVKWPRLMDVTADFVYCRLHGSRELYRSGYNDADLDEWAARVRAWTSGKHADGDYAGSIRPPIKPRDVFLFFDNTDKLHAPENARQLMRRLGQDAPAHARELDALARDKRRTATDAPVSSRRRAAPEAH